MRPGRAVWITGLPATGKTTLAEHLVRALHERGEPVLWLDSDDLRPIFTPNPTYEPEERDRFYAAIAHLAERAAEGGITVIISATAPRREHRDRVRRKVACFTEVLLECERPELERRDPKGLYARAKTGELMNLPGAGVPYERSRPELVLDSGRERPELLADHVLRWLDGGISRN